MAACLAYVDLNPIRAKMAGSPETSDFTSAKMRIKCTEFGGDPAQPSLPSRLFPFAGYPRDDMPIGLPFRLQDYLELLDWTGRQSRRGKRGAIEESLPPILARLNVEPDKCLYTSIHLESSFKGFVGTVQSLVTACQKLGYKRTPGLSAGKLLT